MSQNDRIRQAVDRLAEALHELSYRGRISITPDIRMLLAPGQAKQDDVRHLHAIGLSAEVAELLAQAIEQLLTSVAANPPADTSAAAEFARSNPELAAELADAFNQVDLVALTKAVLDDTAPENRRTVTRALDDLFGDIPTEDDTEAEG